MGRVTFDSSDVKWSRHVFFGTPTPPPAASWPVSEEVDGWRWTVYKPSAEDRAAAAEMFEAAEADRENAELEQRAGEAAFYDACRRSTDLRGLVPAGVIESLLGFGHHA
jgi:hypothetical protein